MFTSLMASILPLNKILDLVKKSLEQTIGKELFTYRLDINFETKQMFFVVDNNKYRFVDGEKFIDLISKGLSEKNIDDKLDYIIIEYKPPNNMAKIYSTDKEGNKILNEKKL